MNRIEQVFGAPRVLLPVIHPIGVAAAMSSIRVAIESGVRGVFLIDQGMSDGEVLDLVMIARMRHPALWVGINLLDVAPGEVLRRGLDACHGRLDGIWADTAEVNEHAAEQPEAQAFVEARRALGWTGLYFGGVAFKYQRNVAVADLGCAAEKALPYMDVICTSGPGTGREAEVRDVVAMRRAIGDRGALALASGVSSTNVASYLPYVDAYLVGTSIESNFGILDRQETSRLQQIIAAATGAGGASTA